MSKRNILDTYFAKSYNMTLMAKEAARFLISRKKDMDLDQTGYHNLLSEINPLTRSHINSLYRTLVEKNKLEHLHLFSMLLSHVGDIPELLTIDDIQIDGKYVASGSPELRKPWINLTPCLSKSESRAGIVAVDDIPKLISLVVRGYLCASYNDSKDLWLPSKVSTFLIEFYTISMSVIMDKLFNLNQEEAFLPNMLFAWHYAAMLGPKGDKEELPVLMMKNQKLFRGTQTGDQLQDLINSVNEIRAGHPMSIDVAVKVLRTLGPSRMRNLSTADVYRSFGISSSDNTAMMVALDYPPYLLHQIMRIADRAKQPLLSNIYRNRFNQAYIKSALDQLIVTKTVIDGVKR